MSTYFLIGVAGILLSGVFAASLVIANVQAHSGPADPCAYASGYGVGVKACSDTSDPVASPPAATRRDAEDQASTEAADRD